MASADLVRESQDPSTSAARLAELAQIDRGLWPAIAVHPAAYPALLDWLGQQGDPTVNAVLALRSSSSVAPPAPPATPPAPPVEQAQPTEPIQSAEPAQATYAAPSPAQPSTASAHESVPPGGTQVSSTPGATGDNKKNFWVLASMVAVVLILIGGVAFGATQIFGGDDDDKDEASSSLTVDAPELDDPPTVGAPDTESDGDSEGGAFCEKFLEAKDALRGNSSGEPASDTAKAIAEVMGEAEDLAPSEIKGDVGVMTDYFETMSDPANLETSKLSDQIKEFTAAGRRVSAYYASNCM
ncbi:variant leucine-rich repeat-containing protein [Aeromicrobium sp. P5_D10]